MEQVVDGLESREHAEFLLEDALQIAAMEGADPILRSWPGLDPLLEPESLRPGQPRRPSGVRSLAEGVRSAPVVLGDPGLDGAGTTAELAGDVGGGAALQGQD